MGKLGDELMEDVRKARAAISCSGDDELANRLTVWLERTKRELAEDKPPTVTLHGVTLGQPYVFSAITSLAKVLRGVRVIGKYNSLDEDWVGVSESIAEITLLARDENAFGPTWSCEGAEPPVVMLPTFAKDCPMEFSHITHIEPRYFLGGTFCQVWGSGRYMGGFWHGRHKKSHADGWGILLPVEKALAACAATGVPCCGKDGLPEKSREALDDARRAVASRDDLPEVYCPRCGELQNGKWFGDGTNFSEKWTTLQCVECGLLFKCLARRTECMTKDPRAEWIECLCDGEESGVPCPPEKTEEPPTVTLQDTDGHDVLFRSVTKMAYGAASYSGMVAVWGTWLDGFGTWTEPEPPCVIWTRLPKAYIIARCAEKGVPCCDAETDAWAEVAELARMSREIYT